jgi:flagellar hook-associated protein 1 FlgK
MEIEQDSGNDFAIVETGSGTFLSETGVRPDYRGISSRLSVRSDLKSNTYFISRGSLQSNTFNSATGTDPAAALTGGSAAEVLTFHIDSSTKVALTLNTSDGSNTLNSVAAAINADATLSAAGITAEVVIDGSNYSIKISDAEGNNFWVNDETSSGSGVAGSLGIVTTQGISVGDGSMAEALAEEFNAITTFLEAPAGGGGMSETNTTLSAYASNILAFNSVQVSTIQRDLSFQENLTLELFSKHNSISGVNMDEELSNLIVIEQAYLAAARMITTTQELFKVLSNMVG